MMAQLLFRAARPTTLYWCPSVPVTVTRDLRAEPAGAIHLKQWRLPRAKLRVVRSAVLELLRPQEQDWLIW
jgi:hypothetical protein